MRDPAQRGLQAAGMAVGEEIVVVDDALRYDAYERLIRFSSDVPLLYGARSNFKTDPHGHWHRDFVTAGPHNLADVSDRLKSDRSLAPILEAWTLLHDAWLGEGVLIRCYLNGYTYGSEGYFHTDSQRPDEHTLILYLNDYWEPDWAGETVFLGATGDITRAVLPRGNRAVIFPSRIEHAGRSVSRKCTALRKALVFKVRRKRSAGFEDLSAFLRRCGAAEREHRLGSLHDHLVRVYSLLETKNIDRDVCFGGGLHAIYGTRHFRHGLLAPNDRSPVAKAFGPRAEELAYLFSILDRPATLERPVEPDVDRVVVAVADGGSLELPRGTFDDLRAIECANLADQHALGRHRALMALWEAR